MKKDTKILHTGVERRTYRAVNLPIYPVSTYKEHGPYDYFSLVDV